MTEAFVSQPVDPAILAKNPEQWIWMHRRWKRGAYARKAAPKATA